MKKALAPKKESLEPTSTIKTFESFLVKKNRLVNEEGDVDAIIAAVTASAGGESGDSEEKPKVVVKKKEAAEALIKTASEKIVKKEIKEEDKAAIEKIVLDKLEKRMNKKELVKGLSKIKGVTIAKDFDPDKDYYSPMHSTENSSKKTKPLATAKGIKFYEGNIAELDYDGYLAYYNPENGYYACFKDRSRGLEFREKITDLINNKGVPKKYRYLTKELVSMFSAFTRDETITKFFKNLTYRSTSTAAAIFRASKYLMREKGIDLLVEIRELAKENEAVKKFYKKHMEAIKKLL